MTENTPITVEPPRRFRFDWVIPALFKPRQTFPKILSAPSTAWLTPMVILTLTALLRVLVSGSVGQPVAMGASAAPPPDFEYYSPDQQMNYQQGVSLTSGPLFTIIGPGILALVGVWIGWLVFGGLMHLTLTLLGGRGATGATIGMVAWANLPFAIRDIVRVLDMMSSNTAFESPGLSGLVTAGGLPSACLGVVEMYIIWHILLLFVGIHTGYGLSRGKSWASVAITVGAAIIFQTLIAFVWAQITGAVPGGM
jgi:hypothetical protein